jgi:hypothetical protein
MASHLLSQAICGDDRDSKDPSAGIPEAGRLSPKAVPAMNTGVSHLTLASQLTFDANARLEF